MPERPAARDRQNSLELRPSAEITPAPVITTWRGISGLDGRLASLATFQQFRDPVHYVPHRPDVLRRVVRDIDVELFFHCEKNVDPVQRIDAELLEGAVGGDLLLREMLDRSDNSSDSLSQFCVG